MVNLGHGSSIVTKQLSADSALVSIHMQSEGDRGDRPYYGGGTIDISFVLNSDQIADLKREVNGLGNDLPFVLQAV